MREDIKKRLEQVQSDTIPEGYQKKNRRGLFPSDWDVKPLKDISSPINENAGEQDLETLSISAGVGFVNQAEKFGRELSGEQYVKYTVLKHGDFSYNKGNSKTYPQGCIYRLHEREIAAVPNVFNSFQMLESICNGNYYAHLFMNGYMNHQLYRLINAGVRNDGLLNLYDKDFYSCKLPVPPLNEQNKIAEILNGCDKVIELKQKLIEEERNRKKWLLQNLFDPDSDFRSVNWLCTWTQSKLLGLCISICDGDWIESKDQSEAGIRLIQTGNIGVNNYIDKGERARYISQNTFDYLNCTEVTNGDVLLSRLPDPIGRACMIENLKEKAITAVDCSILKFHNNTTAKYFLQYASTNVYFKQIAILAGGSTRTRISRKEIENLTIPIPDSLDVQEDIVNALSTIDNNITLLEKELAQWQQKKKSLMQLLLTGLVRVTV